MADETDEKTVTVQGAVDVMTDGQLENEVRALREEVAELNRTLGYVGNVISQAVDGIAQSLQRGSVGLR